jgi:Protein of unknown function (DUF4079)
MGLSLLAYLMLAISGITMFSLRTSRNHQPMWLSKAHDIIGWAMVGLVLLLLAIGLVGTLGHYGNLGHSGHLIAGWFVVALVLVSAVSATQIKLNRDWVRAIHVGTNIVLSLGFAWVSLTGWEVVQKYLP